METVDKLIEREKLTMTAERIDKRPDGLMAHSANHWQCVISGLKDNGLYTSIEVYFSQGSAHTEAPDLPDVLDCLASDALEIEAVSGFEEWANEYGYDVDSRKAEKTYQETLQEAENLLVLLGAEAYAQLLYHVERL